MDTVVLIWFICAIVGAVIGSSKGEAGMGFIAGLLLGPFGVLFAAMSSGDREPCPHCKERIKKKASVCPHCRTQLKPS